MERGTTLHVRKKDYDMSGTDCPSAGPYPNITGMRNLYWGRECTLVKQGAYVYKPTPEQLNRIERYAR